MARHEGKIAAGPAQPLEIDELLALIGRDSTLGADQRRDAIACFLAGGEGWRDARNQLGGAFADALEGVGGPDGLIGRKGE